MKKPATISKRSVRHLPPRRGIAMIYTILTILILAALVAFVIDLGHVHLVKAQLQATADAAARAAVWRIPDQDLQGSNSTSAYSVAKAVASKNSADGTAVALDTTKGDVAIGYWSPTAKTFTAAVSSAGYLQSNAVKVTVYRSAARSDAVQYSFSRIVGGSSSKDLSATAVAMILGSKASQNHGYGIFGKVSVSMSGNATVNSYDPSKAYGGSNVLKGGGVASDGSITLSGNASIQGDARWGAQSSPYAPTGTYLSGNANISGWQGRLDDVISYPSVTIPSSYNNSAITSYLSGPGSPKSLSLSGNTTAIIPAGTYYVAGINISGNASMNASAATGPVTFYVNGSVGISGNGIATRNNLPSNMTINVIPKSGASVSLSGNGSLYAHVYAPDSNVSISGNGDIYGSVIGNSVSITGNGGIHYDGSGYSDGNPNDGIFTVQLVQ